jgi:protein ImuB
MLWLCLHFPTLALEVFTRGQESDEPLLVCDGQGRERQVLHANAAARHAGIRPGMRVSAAFALAGHVRVIPRAHCTEQAALQGLAAWAGQFSSCVHLVEPQALLLEVGGSLTLFRGLEPLLHRIGQGLAELGYSFQSGVAPTKLAATWFARAGNPARITESARLAGALAPLPLAVLELPADQEARLRGMGIARLGDCLRLPRAGLAQRLGAAFVHQLDQAQGRAADPRTLFVPPATFASRLELPSAVAQVQGLVFGLNRLIVELCGWLRAHSAGVMSLSLQLLHARAAVTRIELGLVAPSRDPKHLTELFRERLAQTVLPEAVEALVLNVAQHQPLGTPTRELFSDRRSSALPAAAIIERLRSRLGHDSVQGLQAVADHRPERAQGCATGATSPRAAMTGGPRPYWLLPDPVPLELAGGRPSLGGVLALDGTAERIESGWWDGADIGRDYFVARNPAGECYWIFRELKPPHRWWLHGIFA